MLGITERTFRRWSTRYEAEGLAGLEDRRMGRAAARAVPADAVLQMGTRYVTPVVNSGRHELQPHAAGC